MYVPKHFGLTDDQLAEALGRGGFAHLITPTAGGLAITPLPLLFDEENHSLIGHVARANEHWKVHCDGMSAAVFVGSDAYISPTSYATKSETGKVVPTWNYEVLHVHGTLIAHDDPEWVRGLVTRLTEHHERSRDPRWEVSDAPPEYTTALLKAIVGVELQISRVEGKVKMSQNQPERNRLGVIAALGASSAPRDQEVAWRMSREDSSQD